MMTQLRPHWLVYRHARSPGTVASNSSKSWQFQVKERQLPKKKSVEDQLEESENEESEDAHSEKDETDELDFVGNYKSESGISVEDAPDVVDMKKLKNGEIADKFSTGWEIGTVKGVEKSGCQL